MKALTTELTKVILLLIGLNLSLYGCLFLYLQRERRKASERRARWRKQAHDEMAQDLRDRE